MKKEILLSRKIKINPTKEQRERIDDMIRTRRAIWNSLHSMCYNKETDIINWQQAIAFCKGKYASNIPENINEFFSGEFRRLVRSVFIDYRGAWELYFDKKQKHIPKFKSIRYNNQSVMIYDVGTKIVNNSISIPKLKGFPLRLNLTDKDRRLFEGSRLKTLNFSKNYGNYYISFTNLVEVDVVKSRKGTIGLDWGIRTFLTSSQPLAYGQPAKDGDITNLYYYNLPKRVERLMNRIKSLQRILSRKQGSNNSRAPKSNNFYKVKKKIQRTYEKLANVKKDFIEKLTFYLLSNYDSICIEDLDLIDMRKTCRFFRRAMNINSFYSFRERLISKSERFTGKVYLADRNFPSTKLCSECGTLKEKTPSSMIIYKCKSCGKEIPRDLNAAVNLERYPLLEKSIT